jgi:hypothetical protein
MAVFLQVSSKDFIFLELLKISRIFARFFLFSSIPSVQMNWKTITFFSLGWWGYDVWFQAYDIVLIKETKQKNIVLSHCKYFATQDPFFLLKEKIMI